MELRAYSTSANGKPAPAEGAKLKYQAVLSGASVKLKMDVVPGSLVPFDAFRIIGTSLVFRNERIGTTLSDADLLDGYSFAVKNQNLCGCFDAQRRVFFAALVHY